MTTFSAPGDSFTTRVRIGFAIAPSDPFWVQVREAAKQRAERQGITLIRFPLIPAGAQGEVYLRMLEDFRASEIHALISHSATPAALKVFLDAGLPVICAEESDLRHPLLVSVSGLAQASELAAQFLVSQLRGKGDLLLVGGIESQHATARLRLEGFRQVMARSPGIRVVHLPTPWLYHEVYDQINDEAEETRALFANGAISAIFGISDSVALAARDACHVLGLADNRTLIAGINGDPLAIAAIAAGTMHATVESNPQELGRNLADHALLAARSHPLPDHFSYTLELVTAANVSQVAARKLVAIAELP
ncbi:MAG: sugar ABC transporter substrate-binding protein, partial [Caldilineaceae bacterium]